MTFDQANEFARVNLSGTFSNATNVHVLSDGSFYFDTNLDALSKHAIDNNLEIFTLKGQEIKKAETSEELQPSKKTK